MYFTYTNSDDGCVFCYGLYKCEQANVMWMGLVLTENKKQNAIHIHNLNNR